MVNLNARKNLINTLAVVFSPEFDIQTTVLVEGGNVGSFFFSFLYYYWVTCVWKLSVAGEGSLYQC